ncbi:HipA domain-containing protein [Colwellia sp. BRX10-3]|uniref:type II toxin-antitoxin system HipA family toxin n=1 Tax=Colwellia sp. BRX10-3 TaxID=2759844 RepID=UPI0015F60591|nr:HipA domain-containing protein [Colwellia sp. BRX10-3]MBA6390456.1 HipA domain-containing protein [Colwellia sp. BRX10-3]
MFCKGDLRNTKEKELHHGFSTSHLKAMYQQSEPVSVKGTSDSFDEMVVDHTTGTSISGVQRKMFMTLENNVLVPSNQGEYIVKPTPKHFPQLAENEHAIMKIAERLKIKVAKCSVAPFEDGELAYVTKRFDLTSTAGINFFIEDGASICDVHPLNKGSDALSYETCIKTMVKACGGATAIAAQAVKLVLFSYIVGNNDLHLKNFSLQRKPSSKTHIMDGFTPLYDVLSVAPYPEYDTVYLSLSLLEIETEGDFSSSHDVYGYYTQYDFILLLGALGIKQRVAEKVIMNFTDDLQKAATEVIAYSSLDDKLKTIIMKRINDRCISIKQPILY